jgi:hypothetical protein
MTDRRREPRRQVAADDESLTSELVIGTDGRVHVFGTSRAILEALDAIGVRGDAVRARLAAASATATVTPPTTAASGS